MFASKEGRVIPFVIWDSLYKLFAIQTRSLNKSSSWSAGDHCIDEFLEILSNSNDCRTAMIRWLRCRGYDCMFKQLSLARFMLFTRRLLYCRMLAGSDLAGIQQEVECCWMRWWATWWLILRVRAVRRGLKQDSPRRTCWLGLCSGRSWKDQTAHSRRSVSSCCRQACAFSEIIICFLCSFLTSSLADENR